MMNPSGLGALSKGIEKTVCLISSIEKGLSNHESCSGERDLSNQLENHLSMSSFENASLKYWINSSQIVKVAREGDNGNKKYNKKKEWVSPTRKMKKNDY